MNKLGILNCRAATAMIRAMGMAAENQKRLFLGQIETNFGRAEANRAIRNFRLERKGFNEEPE